MSMTLASGQIRNMTPRQTAGAAGPKSVVNVMIGRIRRWYRGAGNPRATRIAGTESEVRSRLQGVANGSRHGVVRAPEDPDGPSAHGHPPRLVSRQARQRRDEA